jgi:hypothetical protein
MGHLFAEIVANSVGIGERVFNDVMQQAGRDRNCVQPHVGQNVGHLEWVHQVRFPRSALLPAVFTGRK